MKETRLIIDITFTHVFHGRESKTTKDFDAAKSDAEILAQLAEWGYEEVSLIGREWPKYAWPGGYPIYYITKDAGILSAESANAELPRTLDSDDAQFFVIAQEINYEDNELFCDHSGKRIPSAYCEEN